MGSIWEFANAYTAVDSLIPGKGYWVNVIEDGQLILGNFDTKGAAKAAVNNSVIENFNGQMMVADSRGRSGTLYFSDKSCGIESAMPPAPPAGYLM